jgi:hypothetical protein
MRLIYILLFVANIAYAGNYYVSGTGSDSNNGTSVSTPFLTIKYAHGFTKPGDTVWIMNGTYTPAKWDHVVKITRSGKADSVITYKAYPGHKPFIYVTKDKNCWAAIRVEASYIAIEGLELMGDNDNITMQEADSVYNHYKTATVKNWDFIANTNTNGIYVVGAVKNEPGPRNVSIKNCLVHKFPGGGIGAERADYVTFENNVIHSNAWFMIWAGSGISVFHSYDADSNFTSYKNIVRNNICYRNECYIKWADKGVYSDGNGIIIDDTKNSQISKTPYKGRTLVENNLSYLNGGGGINIYSSENVDVYNNTTYGNSHSPHLDYSNLGGVSNTNVKFFNNIAYAAKTTDYVNSGMYQNVNVVYQYNIFYNGIISTAGTNNLTADPLFVDIASANFQLSAGSPAINAANTSYAPAHDLLGVARTSPDMGAYEYVALPTSLTEFSIASDFSVYPNPSMGIIHLKVPANTQVYVYDILGQLVYSVKTINRQLTLDFSSKKGVYFIHTNDSKHVQKVVVN